MTVWDADQYAGMLSDANKLNYIQSDVPNFYVFNNY